MTVLATSQNEIIDITVSVDVPRVVIPNCSIRISNISMVRYSPSFSSTPQIYGDSARSSVTANGEKALEQPYIISLNRLKEIEKLEDNWNGNGALAFPRSQILMMKQIVRMLRKQPFITPSAVQVFLQHIVPLPLFSD